MMIRGASKSVLSRSLNLGRTTTTTTRAIATTVAARTVYNNTMGTPTMLAVVATMGGIGLLSANHHKTTTYNHCQVPCGIFDDEAMVNELKQNAETIRKAVTECQKLSKKGNDPLTMNQMVRWIMTKEEHCQKIINIVSNYCLCQRIKPIKYETELEYNTVLKIHHALMQAAMKAKQSMDLEDVKTLDAAIFDLKEIYVYEED